MTMRLIYAFVNNILYIQIEVINTIKYNYERESKMCHVCIQIYKRHQQVNKRYISKK